MKHVGKEGVDRMVKYKLNILKSIDGSRNLGTKRTEERERERKLHFMFRKVEYVWEGRFFM
jgi:hypothetical protein